MRAILLLISTLLVGCDRTPPRQVVETDTRAAFALDPSKPFVVELGRGSGLEGLDIIKVDQSGTVKMSRRTRDQDVESASLNLTGPDLATLVTLVNTNKLTTLGQSYSDPRVADGTQWILWIQQGASEKAVYFNNSFPAEITAFANALDALLSKAGSTTATWTPLPSHQAADEQKALWARIAPPRPSPSPQ